MSGVSVWFGGIAVKVEIIQISAVAAAAAKAHAVGLIEFAVAGTVIAFQKGFFHAFYRQIQTPVLTVDGDIDKTAQRGVHAKLMHHCIGQIVFHHGGILNQIIQAQFVQAMIGAGTVVMVKLNLETVSLTAESGYGGERGVALCPDPYIFAGFSIDYHIGCIVFFAGCICDKVIPVIHGDINGMYLCVVK